MNTYRIRQKAIQVFEYIKVNYEYISWIVYVVMILFYVCWVASFLPSQEEPFEEFLPPEEEESPDDQQEDPEDDQSPKNSRKSKSRKKSKRKKSRRLKHAQARRAAAATEYDLQEDVDETNHGSLEKLMSDEEAFEFEYVEDDEDSEGDEDEFSDAA